MISLYDILEASNGQLFGEPAGHMFTDFCFDSRRAGDAHLFVTLRTDRGDTHQYIREAVERGATGIVCTHPPDFDTQGLSVIIVRDTETALMAWSRYVLQRFGPQVICVSGSAGKTLSVEAIRHVLGTRYRVHSSRGDAVGWLAVPTALASLEPDHEILVMELNLDGPGQMAGLVETLQPVAGVITTIGYSRTDTFTSVEEIVSENRLLLSSLPESGLAILNLDDDYARALSKDTPAQVLTLGIDSFGADLIAYSVVVSLTKTGFDLRFRGERFVGRWTPWLGRHHLYAALTGLAAGIQFVVPLDEALRAVSEMPYLPGRMNPLVGLNGCTVIDDTFSATPASTQAALNWMQAVNEGRPSEDRHRLIFVFGDMDHLGDYSHFGHRSVGQRAAEVADIIITEGTDAALASRAVLDRGRDPRAVSMTYSIQDTIALLVDQIELNANDTVVITGGESSRMELVVQALLRDKRDRTQLPRQDAADDAAVLVEPTRLSWVEIDLDAIAGNVRGIKRLIGDQVALMAVVKADAYGHGAVQVSRTALLNGAEYLAVGSMAEALELREAGIDAPLLVLNYTPVSAVRQAIRQRITLTLYDLNLARAYDRAARELGSRLSVHVKVDTGMGRLGVLPRDTTMLFRHLMTLKFLELEGIFTHLSSADEDEPFTAMQVRHFRDVLKPLRASGMTFAYTHAANSAGMLLSKDTHFNMVRVGLAMYGQSPSQMVRVPEDFQPAMTWKTVVAQVKMLPPNHPVGYGRTYHTIDEERIAILPVGYADGFRRGPNNWGEVLIHGQRAPLIGRVSMEKATVSISHIPDVSIGDEVVLLGRQGGAAISADEVAARLGTISYEVLTGILPRVPRR